MANQAAVGEYQEMLRHGTMSVGIYTPREVDNQKPHSQDEVYIIASGTGVFCAGQRADRVRSWRHVFRRRRVPGIDSWSSAKI